MTFTAPDRYEAELRDALSRLGWYAPHLGEKFPGLDNLCVFPHPESKSPEASETPGMVIGIQVKGMRAPTASALSLKNLLIMRRMQIPIFWFHVEKGRRHPRRISHLSSAWLSEAIRLMLKHANERRVQFPKPRSIVVRDLPSSKRDLDALQAFLVKCYEDHLRTLPGGDALAVAFTPPSLRRLRQLHGYLDHFMGMAPSRDVEAVLEAAKTYRKARVYEKADAYLREATTMLQGSRIRDPRIRSRLYYELAYLALSSGSFAQARKWARQSARGVDPVRRAIGMTVEVLTYYVDSLRSLRLIPDFNRKVISRLKTLKNSIRAARVVQPSDRPLKQRWEANIRLHYAEALLLPGLLAQRGRRSLAGARREAARNLKLSERYWRNIGSLDGLGSCAFLRACLALIDSRWETARELMRLGTAMGASEIHSDRWRLVTELLRRKGAV